MVLLLLAAFSTAALRAGIPTDAAERAALIGQPTEIVVTQGAALTLSGPRDVSQVVVTAKYANGQLRDLTGVVEATSSAPDILAVGEGVFLRGKKNGVATVTIKAGGKTATIAVTVKDFEAAKPVSFRNDVIAALNVGGCNAGACHGTPSGKNGFKLSLRGFDPAADFAQLTRDQFGRRADPLDAGASLMVLKTLGRVPHEGGARLAANSLPLEMMTAWLAEGAKPDAAALPTLKKIEVTPSMRIQLNPSRWQQLAVKGTFSDDATRDATRLTVFSSSDPGVADVSMNGLVEFKRAGEVAILCRYLEEMVSVRLTYLEPRPGFVWPNVPEKNIVDTQTFAKLKLMTILPSDLCGDSDFVRRVFLDSIGRLPTAAETTAFVDSKETDKREKLIDVLLKKPEFADFWALKWADVLRSSRKTIQLKGSTGFQMWLREKIATNEPFDKIVTELLTSTGNTYSNPPANYYRIAKDPMALAESTAQLFLGVRMQCAKCHNHPFERWTQDDYYGLSAVFARIKTKPEPNTGTAKPANPMGAAEVVYALREGEVTQPRTQVQMKPRFPGSGEADVPKGADRRAVFAEWLTKPGNAFFAKSVANRVWFHLVGKGIVDPVDDFRESNPSANDELLEALASEFTKSKFDLRALVGLILKSRTYQLSAVPNETNREDTKYFSHAVTKLLTAEQILDALSDFTGVPEKFAGLPAGTRAIQLPDGEVNHPFLKTFGQPARELACECERESDGNLAQALQLINGPTVNEKVKNPTNRIATLLAAKKGEREMLDDLYLVALARKADEDEAKAALAHVTKGTDKRKAWEDVLWAILNTREFLFRH